MNSQIDKEMYSELNLDRAASIFVELGAQYGGMWS